MRNLAHQLQSARNKLEKGDGGVEIAREGQVIKFFSSLSSEVQLDIKVTQNH